MSASDATHRPFLIRVVLPYHLRTLAGVGDEVSVSVQPPVTVALLLDALEKQFPVLRGTIRDHGTLRRRPFLRFFADGNDLSNEPLDTRLPEVVLTRKEPFLVVGAIAGG